MNDRVTSSRQGWWVVIIDDSVEDRGEIRRLLFRGAERRYSFTEAETGAAGIEVLRSAQNMPDCVILDFNLPDMDALEVLAQLATSDDLPACPIVVLTGEDDAETGNLVLRAGAQDYIGKNGLTALGLTRIVENAKERFAMTRELTSRNTALLHIEKKLYDADRRKDEFIATLAHELRNPLAPIANGLQALRLAKIDAPAKILDIMERQVSQMTRLIDDLMEVSRISNGKILLHPRRMLATALLEEAAEASMPIINLAQHSLSIQSPSNPIWLEVDPARMVQVIGNLLNNASKYSHAGSEVTLSVDQDGSDAVIKVTDKGIGIPEAMLGQVFDMFSQVSNTIKTSLGGLGIGLALVKQLVEMQGGIVYAESAGVDQGSTFVIRIPVASAPEEFVPEANPQDSETSDSRRILIVDDKVDAAATLSMILSLSGHTTRISFSGEEALAIGPSFNPEIVFLDLGLPGMGGLEVAKHFRKAPVLEDAVIVALTGWGGPADRLKSKEAGCDLHLTKPAHILDVNNVLSQFASLSEERRSLSQR